MNFEQTYNLIEPQIRFWSLYLGATYGIKGLGYLFRKRFDMNPIPTEVYLLPTPLDLAALGIRSIQRGLTNKAVENVATHI